MSYNIRINEEISFFNVIKKVFEFEYLSDTDNKYDIKELSIIYEIDKFTYALDLNVIYHWIDTGNFISLISAEDGRVLIEIKQDVSVVSKKPEWCYSICNIDWDFNHTEIYDNCRIIID